MNHRLITATSLIKTVTKPDTLFKGKYLIDPYQNCEFACSYCDSSFEKTVFIKHNAAKLLQQELTQHNKDIIIVGSVHDPYQPAEKNYQVTRNLLSIIKKNEFPCHILTKSTLVLRDLDLLRSMHCMVTISITTLNNTISTLFEHNAPTPQKRIRTLHTLRNHGIIAGIALIPLLPFLIEENLEKIVQTAKKMNAQYFLFKHLELKGDQKKKFLDVLASQYPHLVTAYQQLYSYRYQPKKSYRIHLAHIITSLCKTYKLSTTLPTLQNKTI
jgi:DNA repair photolyase